MTGDEIDNLIERVGWLERKMVRVLWLLVSMTSAFVGFIVAYNIDKDHGWVSILVAFGVWFALAAIVSRQEFKGAPKNVQFIDP